ncbi:uncharacterized protein LOC107036678 [Diachasma alloeum]|uniref:uncharacterized protein LOC107036678 n=1 Tax=Diachasma alloeum TaxID=454923 RepID=UPI00073823A5|nr:uncharacterized protein LOC107036678 [Diachasma alloeum]
MEPNPQRTASQLRSWAIKTGMDDENLCELWKILQNGIFPGAPPEEIGLKAEAPSSDDEEFTASDEPPAKVARVFADPLDMNDAFVTKKDLQDFQARVDEKLDGISRSQQKILKLLLEQKRDKETLEALQSGTFGESFSQIYNIPFPLPTMENLLDLDEKLLIEDCQRDFMKLLQFFWNPKETSVSKQALAILSRLLDREVAMRLTAVKKTGDKITLKSISNVWTCIANLFEIKGTWCFDDVETGLGKVLTRASDWNGKRPHRSKNPT